MFNLALLPCRNCYSMTCPSHGNDLKLWTRNLTPLFVHTLLCIRSSFLLCVSLKWWTLTSIFLGILRPHFVRAIDWNTRGAHAKTKAFHGGYAGCGRCRRTCRRRRVLDGHSEGRLPKCKLKFSLKLSSKSSGDLIRHLWCIFIFHFWSELTASSNIKVFWPAALFFLIYVVTHMRAIEDRNYMD